MDLAARRRPLLSTLLACILAVESVTAVAAAAGVSGRGHVSADAAGAEIAASGAGAANVDAASEASANVDLRDTDPGDAAPAVATPTGEAEPVPKPARPDAPPAPARVVSASTTGTGEPAGYRGRNHVWIPSLGIDRSVSAFACSRSRPPDHRVYRWGCAGANNVYLFGHAASVFRPLHDAYVAGRLRTGMRVFYADGAGRVRAYAVRWWKVTLPTPESKWAWAAQSTPSMTLQTCVGANSEYRLMVRLTEVR
jgi:hypothetical protein